jgi:hypothetical protein
MTTAIECQHFSQGTGNFATRTVLQQAGSAAQSWLPEISQRFKPSPGFALVYAAVPFFVALILLSLPGTNKGTGVNQVMNNSAPSVPADDNKNLQSSNDDVAALRRLIVDESSGNTQSSSEERSSTLLVPSQINATATVSDLPPAPDQEGRPGGVAGLAGNDGESPGNATARSTPAIDKPTEPARFQKQENIVLQRNGPTISAGERHGADYSKATQWQFKAPGLIQAAAAPDSLTNSTILSRAQAAHAKLYLEGLGKNND